MNYNIKGFRDGTLSVFDVRLPDECEIMRLTDFSAPILGVALTSEKTRVIAGAADGEFRVYEPRMYHVRRHAKLDAAISSL